MIAGLIGVVQGGSDRMTNERGRHTAADFIHSVQEAAKVESSFKFERIRVSSTAVKRKPALLCSCPGLPEVAPEVLPHRWLANGAQASDVVAGGGDGGTRD